MSKLRQDIEFIYAAVCGRVGKIRWQDGELQQMNRHDLGCVAGWSEEIIAQLQQVIEAADEQIGFLETEELH